MESTELLSLALTRLADAVGDLLREGADPAAHALVVTDADSPIGEVLLGDDADALHDAACIMLPVDTLARILEAHAFDAAASERIAAWLEEEPAPDCYRVVAIGRASVAAITVDTAEESPDDLEEAPVSLLLH